MLRQLLCMAQMMPSSQVAYAVEQARYTHTDTNTCSVSCGDTDNAQLHPDALHKALWDTLYLVTRCVRMRNKTP